MFTKKLRKLKREPKLFFKDMAYKRLYGINFLMSFLYADKFQKNKGHYQYAVVSAVYNVDKYLNYFFRTLTRQTIGFTEHIHLIMVDDGSTDSSARIIKKWQEKFPNNITYIYKENGGQASARNLGLEVVESDYVTFIDPDDFVALDYFKVIDDFIAKNQKQSIKLIICNLIFYKEITGSFSDNHPLRYRFTKGNRIIQKEKLGADFQMSASSAFFDADVISRTALKFDERIKPNFEDAHFVGRFFEMIGESSIAFLKDAKYYYRKREDGTSTLDTKWSKPGFFDDLYRYGYIGLLNFFRERGQLSIPMHIQRTLLYDTAWVIKEIINNPEKLSVLSHEARLNFLKYLYEIYASIDSQTILEFELAGVWFYHKVGFLHCFKQEKPPFQIVYIEEYDSVKEQIKLVYYTDEVDFEQFLIDSKDVIPAYAKTACHDFLDRTFVLARHIWLPIAGNLDTATLTIQVAKKEIQTRISFNGKQLINGIKLSDILAKYKISHIPSEANAEWLIMDRDTQADDNAEHFYRYIKEHYPEQSARFVLRKDAHDWNRLKQEGFNLLAYGSTEHENALRECGKIISSHADQHVTDYFKDGSLKKKQFIFLQHGVTKDDMSKWLNPKKIDCFITSSSSEFESIAGNFNRYKFSNKEVVLTGFPRHDALLKRQKSYEVSNIILVSPTWRNSLMGKQISGNLREKNPEFMNSQYAKAWQSFLCSNGLKDLVEESGYQVVFFPHANTQPYLQEFNLPSHISLASHNEISIQELFCKAKIMITDFSSVAFEMAFLEKSILYYQFDRKEFYSGSHNWQPGYFDYDADGFGPVCFDEKGLLNQLEESVNQNGKVDSIYQGRMAKFFAYRDGLNCERTYQAIKNLDETNIANQNSVELQWEFALTAEKNADWELAEKRWRKLLESNLVSRRSEAQLHLVNILRHQEPSLLDDIQSGLRRFQQSVDNA
jgi:CDP-glycerol glycerophosphotransferase (TagB/SpsB family)/glycosyltransferase involved in cell wall biosynthesis